MSVFKNQIFTDAIKDVVGNEPVVDQFDISYEASFYGTSQDDFITGSMLSKIDPSAPRYSSTSGRVFEVIEDNNRVRGRAFSKFYAESAPSLESGFGSRAVDQNPSLSFRLTPNFSRASTTAYRIKTAYDSTERFYDSCLPPLAQCLATDGTQVWTVENDNNNPLLSPIGNVVTGSDVGYVFLNSDSEDWGRGTTTNDPTVNNTWSWSFPFEPRYSSIERQLSAKNPLGSIVSTLALRITSSFHSVGSLVFSSKTREISRLIPILPGRLGSQDMPPNARQGFRNRYSMSSGSINPVAVVDSTFSNGRVFDSIHGYSFLIPSDIALNAKINHPWMGASDPGTEYVTSSMHARDAVKVMFGFGDLNNVSVSQMTLDKSIASSSFNKFEVANSGSTQVNAAALGSFTNDFLSLNWAFSPAAEPWFARSCYSNVTDTYGYLDGSSGSIYNHISGVLANLEVSPQVDKPVGLYWLSSSAPSDAFVLGSATYTTWDPTTNGLALGESSSGSIDITSSYPWTLRYKRGIAGVGSKFVSYFAGTPEIPSSRNTTPYSPIHYLDYLPGTRDWDVMTTYDSDVSGALDPSTRGKQWPPGAYRLVFRHSVPPVGSAAPSVISLSAINDLEIVQYTTASFTPDVTKRIGSNSYPVFGSYRVDPRANINAGLGDDSRKIAAAVTASVDFYSSKVFGIGPMIRGWKYGLASGFPVHSRVVYKRDHFGHMRDMLEQRLYTKFAYMSTSLFDNEVTIASGSNSDLEAKQQRAVSSGLVGDGPVSVKFIRRGYTRDARGIGTITNTPVDPSATESLNLSTECTSSLPYFDGLCRSRPV